ncbi:LOW QUALITY PROTEIN: UBN2 domain-containing protein, partial [Cephalotus follicularis]
VTYEGTNQVKEKISMLVHKYELFMMHDNENISHMFTRFTTIVNSLTIEEAKDLTTLPLEQLLGSLMSHETSMMNHEKEETKKKNVALRTSKEENKNVSDEDEEIDNDDSSSDEESNVEAANIAFMAIEKEEKDDEVQFSFDELQSAYKKLFYEYENVNLKNRTLKKNV